MKTTSLRAVTALLGLFLFSASAGAEVLNSQLTQFCTEMFPEDPEQQGPIYGDATEAFRSAYQGLVGDKPELDAIVTQGPVRVREMRAKAEELEQMIRDLHARNREDSVWDSDELKAIYEARNERLKKPGMSSDEINQAAAFTAEEQKQLDEIEARAKSLTVAYLRGIGVLESDLALGSFIDDKWKKEAEALRIKAGKLDDLIAAGPLLTSFDKFTSMLNGCRVDCSHPQKRQPVKSGSYGRPMASSVIDTTSSFPTITAGHCTGPSGWLKRFFFETRDRQKQLTARYDVDDRRGTDDYFAAKVNAFMNPGGYRSKEPTYVSAGRSMGTQSTPTMATLGSSHVVGSNGSVATTSSFSRSVSGAGSANYPVTPAKANPPIAVSRPNTNYNSLYRAPASQPPRQNCYYYYRGRTRYYYCR